MPLPDLPDHVRFRVELAEVIANAVALHIRIKEYQADQKTHHTTLAGYPIPDDLVGTDYAEKQQHFEDELESVLDHLVCKYQETPLSTLECFYSPGDAEDVAAFGQDLIDWTSNIRKHLIQLKVETAKLLQEKEKNSEILKDSLLSDFLPYEERLKKIYRSVVKFEYWLKIKYKPPPPSTVVPDTRISSHKPNDSAPLTERLDKIRNTLTTFESSRPEFSSNLFRILQTYRLESLQSTLTSQCSNTISQAVNDIKSECLPSLLSTAKSGYQQVLTENENAFDAYLTEKMQASMRLVHDVLGVTNAALMAVREEGEIIE